MLSLLLFWLSGGFAGVGFSFGVFGTTNSSSNAIRAASYAAALLVGGLALMTGEAQHG